MKHLLPLVMVLAGLSAAHAQNFTKIYPLEEELKKTTVVSRQAQINLELLLQYEVYNIEKSLKHGSAAYELATMDSLKDIMAEAAYRLGAIYQFDENDVTRALEWYQKGLKLAEQIKDSSQVTDFCYNLGLLLNENGDKNRAFTYLDKASHIAARRGDYTMVVMAEVAHGNKLYAREDKLKHFQKALLASKDLDGDTVTLAQAWSAMGQYFHEIKDEAQASYWFEKVFELLHVQAAHSSDHYLLELFATACLRTKRYDESIQVAGKIVGLRNSPGSSEWYSLEGMKLLAEGYYYNGYDSLAFWTAMAYANKKDSLQEIRNSGRVQRNVQTLQAEFEVKQQEKEVRLLLEKNTYERYFGYLLVFCILIISILALYWYRERQREFNQNKQLARINQTKDKLLSIISHDVRSPIQALQNIINLFEQDIATKEDVHTVTRQVSSSVQAMAQGLDNLFYWAQSQQQELKAYPEPFSLSEMVMTLVDLFSERIRKKELTITHNLDTPAMIVADILHTRLIVSNILVNAIKFSPVKGIIDITFTAGADDIDILSITDSGKGIPAADVEKIFDPTIRYTRPGTTGEPGSGLGLSLTRDLLQLDQNDLEIHSYPGNGTRIDLIFKRKKSPI